MSPAAAPSAWAVEPLLPIASSWPAFVSSVLALPSNSDHFCQISGLALDFSVSEPSGNSAVICVAMSAIVSAFTATASALPAFSFA